MERFFVIIILHKDIKLAAIGKKYFWIVLFSLSLSSFTLKLIKVNNTGVTEPKC